MPLANPTRQQTCFVSGIGRVRVAEDWLAGFRRSVATVLSEMREPVCTTQQVLGHSSPHTNVGVPHAVSGGLATECNFQIGTNSVPKLFLTFGVSPCKVCPPELSELKGSLHSIALFHSGYGVNQELAPMAGVERRFSPPVLDGG